MKLPAISPFNRQSGPAKSLARVAIGTLVGFGALVTSVNSSAIEEPEYTVVRQLAGIEIRDYPAFTVAETIVPGPGSEAGSRAFPILAGYIFGKNKGDRKLAMTAPVTQTDRKSVV